MQQRVIGSLCVTLPLGTLGWTVQLPAEFALPVYLMLREVTYGAGGGVGSGVSAEHWRTLLRVVSPTLHS